jgi:hypothetical protein
MQVELITRDIYLRHTAGDGSSTVREQRVWDAERFIAAQQAEAEKLASAAREKQEPAGFAVEQITQEQYRNERTQR